MTNITLNESLRPALRRRRFLAFFIEILTLVAFIFLFFLHHHIWDIMRWPGPDHILYPNLWFIFCYFVPISLLIWCTYNTFTFLRTGQTFVFQLLNLRVVNINDSKASPLRLLLNICRTPLALFYPLVILAISIDFNSPLDVFLFTLFGLNLLNLGMFIPEDALHRSIYDILTDTRVVSLPTPL